ncbi:MAG: GNAT family N-acetyltransferase [Rhizobiaceae bacterium]
MARKAAAKPFTVRVTHLEMVSPPVKRAAMPSRPRLALMRAPHIPLAFYRYLYEQVGKPHHWMVRREMADAELTAILHAETAEIQVLYADGAPAGFFELDLARMPREVEIVYFGMAPEFQGLGIGKFFFSEALDAAWAHAPARVTLHTNTLDSPRALHIYQKAGFSPCGYSQETVTHWL